MISTTFLKCRSGARFFLQTSSNTNRGFFLFFFGVKSRPVKQHCHPRILPVRSEGESANGATTRQTQLRVGKSPPRPRPCCAVDSDRPAGFRGSRQSGRIVCRPGRDRLEQAPRTRIAERVDDVNGEHWHSGIKRDERSPSCWCGDATATGAAGICIQRRAGWYELFPLLVAEISGLAPRI